MSPVLQVGDRTLTATEVLPLLAEYQLLPQLVKEIVISQAIAEIECTQQETKLACQQLAQQYQLTSDAMLQLWLQQNNMSAKQFEALAVRQLKLEKFKQNNWGKDLDAYFIQRKPLLDRVVYSLIRTTDLGIAQEIYFRIKEGEQSFIQLAREFAQGPEKETDGLIGPVELQALHPVLAKLLLSCQPQQLLPPTQVGDWIVIVRLEKLLTAKLEASMRQRLINERFHQWLQMQISAQNWQIHQSELIATTNR
ncbi:peptidylprolyl isomerase [Chlorogloeopsis sp. ULAP01]|uniref:peptidylprolyl isomerase n=1 Tax=Chlorogloeopsis sp. ULAP01 TaxID=3056483 RepID=UPI0025AB1199|nr:peptidylprolyl isomerase [Chlorogloeopsis sp. ULAP01]MDM9382605.1 peptidylprolyl isomerase [Chlorogloeopsis sp. ULAP01]